MKNSILAITLILAASCGDQRKGGQQKNTEMENDTFKKGSFGYDLRFLQDRDEDLIVLHQGESQVIVSPKYQAKVFTSSSEGANGKSFGWINYEAFDQEEDPHMNAYGGENRFWLGPEGSKFSLFFKPDSEMVFENWKTPPPIDVETWKVNRKTDQGVELEKEMSLLNYAGTPMEIKADRAIEILAKEQIEDILEITLDQLKVVGFSTKNAITNTGDNAWTPETGAPCIWILDMFTPSKKTVVFIPYRKEAEGRVVTTDYFGEIPEDRISYADGKLFFKADGKSRGKLGIPPERAKTVAGSYDPVNNLLTITSFDVEPEAIYLNQEWTADKNPLLGDAVNAYNDGPLEDGTQMGPFYEIESVSPAAFLAPGDKRSHRHDVFHFTGEEQKLNEVSREVLGVGLKELETAFTQ